MGARKRTMGVMTGDPDPNPVVPFLVSRNPDKGRSTGSSAMVKTGRWRRAADLDVDHEGGRFSRCDKGEDTHGQSDHAKRNDFHRSFFDWLHALKLQIFLIRAFHLDAAWK
jgi:hypothetical protein